MNDRIRALEILQQAREILARRLTERILESGEEILDDALGNSYSGEIENLHDQIGVPLGHVNAMLVSLPSTDVSMAGATMEMSGHQDLLSTAAGDHLVAEAPAPVTTVTVEPGAQVVAVNEPASFALFARQIQAADLAEAAACLAELLGLPLARAGECAARFHIQYTTQPDFLAEAMRLRGELQSGGVNGVLLLLWDCFGLQGVDAIGAMQVLKARMGSS